MKTNYLIIGQGLAGTLLAHELMKANESFVVVDAFKESTSSKVAAGMYNPISGKRMVKSWNADELLQDTFTAYKELEILLNCQLLFQQNIYQLFGSVKEQNDLSTRMDNDDFAKHVNLFPAKELHLNDGFGAFEIKETGWVYTRALIEKMRQLLLAKNALIDEQFDYGQLTFTDDLWHYKNIQAKYIVFCEGYQNKHNPYFNYLPFVLCKGEVFTIQCAGLTQDKIIKKGIYLVNLHDNFYKVGATYEWNDLTENTTEAGKTFLTEKLDELLNCPYEIVKHEANIRPTTKDRKAIVGEHLNLKNMFVLNGLGTKGVMHAPYLAKQLLAFIEQGTAIDKEISIRRFDKVMV
ncbi:MAG: FAD-dependent oxidoreductase [Bacteroidota bacterium]